MLVEKYFGFFYAEEKIFMIEIFSNIHQNVLSLPTISHFDFPIGTRLLIDINMFQKLKLSYVGTIALNEF